MRVSETLLSFIICEFLLLQYCVYVQIKHASLEANQIGW